MLRGNKSNIKAEYYVPRLKMQNPKELEEKESGISRVLPDLNQFVPF